MPKSPKLVLSPTDIRNGLLKKHLKAVKAFCAKINKILLEKYDHKKRADISLKELGEVDPLIESLAIEQFRNAGWDTSKCRKGQADDDTYWVFEAKHTCAMFGPFTNGYHGLAGC